MLRLGLQSLPSVSSRKTRADSHNRPSTYAFAAVNQLVAGQNLITLSDARRSSGLSQTQSVLIQHQHEAVVRNQKRDLGYPHSSLFLVVMTASRQHLK